MQQRRGRGGFGRRVAAFAWVCRYAPTRRLVLAYLCFALVESSTWVGSLLFAYEQGGTVDVGRAAFLMMVPAAVLAPFASFCGDRFDRVKVVTVAYGLLGLFSAASAAALAAEANTWLIYVSLSALVTAAAFPRPTVNALTPTVVESTEQLTAVNVAIGLANGSGMTLGPAIAAGLLAVGDLRWLFCAAAGLGVMAAVSMGRVRVSRLAAAHDREPMTLRSMHRETMAGMTLLRRQREPRAVVAALGLDALLIGVIDVAGVVAALEVLRRDEGFAGVLAASFGAGVIIGASLGVVAIGRRRLAPVLLLAATAQALPLAGLATPGLAGIAAVIILGCCGTGASLADLCGLTLLQGITPDDVMARVLGCLEGLRMACFATGSLACSVVLDALGPRAGFGVIAVVLVAAALLMAPRLLRIDRLRVPADPEVFSVLRNTDVFGLLPAYTLERLAQVTRRIEFDDGEQIIAEGDIGETMFVVAEGVATVQRNGEVLRTCGRAGYFGELALLYDAPRNAAVVASGRATLFEVPRDEFLEAVTGHPRLHQRVEAIATARR